MNEYTNAERAKDNRKLKRAMNAAEISRKQTLPPIPFLYRTYSEGVNETPNHMGILYLAISQDEHDPDLIYGAGSRIIGHKKGTKEEIREFQAFGDPMPKSSIYEIYTNAKVLSNAEKNKLIQNSNFFDFFNKKTYKDSLMNQKLYTDGKSYWFKIGDEDSTYNSLKPRAQSRSSSNRTNARTRSNRTNPRSKSNRTLNRSSFRHRRILKPPSPY